MLSYAPIRSADSAADYFARYYAGDAERGDGEPPGQWGGAGAERLGLHGEVSRDDLLAAFRGVAPRTGEQLVPQDKRGNIAGNDLTFSAPKSVSAVWAVADAPTRRRIEAAQQRAVDAAMARLTAEAIKARRGQGGQERIGTEPVYASFPHSTSRANDPQLHTHCVVINMGYAADGRWSRVDYDIRATHAAGALYRAALADELRQMGFQIQREPPGRGGRDEGYFRIVGVPDRLIEEWSKRRAKIEARLSEADAWGAAAASRVSATSREGKENPNRAENFERWRAQAQEHGFGPEAVARLREERGPGREAAGAEREDIQDEEIVRRVFETRAAVRDTDIARAVYSAAVGRESAAEAQARLERVRAQLVPLERTDPRTGRGETYYATPEDVALAERLPKMVDDLRASRGHAADAQAVEDAIASRPTLRDEQARFIRAMARDEGFAIAEGRAGTGKSFALEALREAYERSGYTVRGVAVQGKAAADLQASTGIESSTIARFRQQLDSGAVRLDSKTVIVIEEAGMVASRDAAAIMAAAREARAKVIMAGDTRQLPPVCAGRPMQDAIRQLGRPDAELVQVVRQREQLDRDIAERFREGRAAEAREMMAREGRWHAVETRADAVHAAARAYAQERAAGGDSLIVASTRRDAYAANLAARAALRKEGALGEREVRFRGHDGRDIRLAEGDRVLFRANTQHYKNGTIGEVTRIEDGRFEVRVGQGEDARTLTFDLPDRERLDRLREAMERPGRPEEVAGRLRAYEREAARQEAAQARLDGIAYGHAVTVHASQGATVRQSAGGVGGNVHIVARDGGGISRELMYVAASRNQAAAHVYIRREEDAAITARAAKAAQENTLTGYRRVAAAEASADRGNGGAAAQGVSRQDETRSTVARAERGGGFEGMGEAGRDAAMPGRHDAGASRTRGGMASHGEHSVEQAMRDRELARAALATKGRMPGGRQLRRDIEAGRAEMRVAGGERFLVYRDGRVYHPGLHGRVRDTKIGMLNSRRAIVVDRYAIDFEAFGRRYQWLKTGERVLIGRETFGQKIAGAIKDRTQPGGIINRWAARHEGWREARLGERLEARLNIWTEERAQRRAARETLEGMARRADRIITTTRGERDMRLIDSIRQAYQDWRQGRSLAESLNDPARQATDIELSPGRTLGGGDGGSRRSASGGLFEGGSRKSEKVTVRGGRTEERKTSVEVRGEPSTGQAQPKVAEQQAEVTHSEQPRQWSREELAERIEELKRSSRTASEHIGAQTLDGWKAHADHAERWGRQELAEGRRADGEGLLRYSEAERRSLQQAVEDQIADRRRDMTDRTLAGMKAEAEQARARGDERTAQELERRAGPIATRQDEAARARAVGDLDRADRLERGASEQAARVREEVPAVAERVERGRETDMSSEQVREARDWGREPSREACQETSRQAERSADHGHDR